MKAHWSKQFASAAFAVTLTFAAAAFAQHTGATHSTAATAPATSSDPWWKHAVIYEVYPRSFGDSNGDGVGDLNGITQHLDYLQQLGVDTIWLAPIYPSPQVDFGYDISNYEAVDPQYGTLKDFDHLLAEAKKRNLRIVLDMVLNHTSDKDPWFIESASSRTSAKADWYVWNNGIPAGTPNLNDAQKQNVHKGANGDVVPPNNWQSAFGGSAWEWVPARQQFYYHMFYPQQPDLNWRNPAVEQAMFNVMRFWLDRGVSGFRLDAIQTLYEDPQLRNAPANNAMFSLGYTYDLPEVHDVLRRLHTMVASYPGQRVLIGELLEPNMAGLDKFYGGEANNELQLPMDYFFGFPHLLTGGFTATRDKLDVSFYRQHLIDMSTQLHGSRPFLFFNNHDNVRSIDRFGDGTHNVDIARINAALLLTTPATVQLFEGEEISMVTTTPARREDVKDPVGRREWPTNKGRDGERTPMQWTPGPQSGFSTDPDTWLPIPPSYKTTNVQTEEGEPDSMLSWYKALIALRRTNPAMRDGGIKIVDKTNPNVLSFVRTAPANAKPVVVMMNFTASPQTANIELHDAGVANGTPHPLLVSPGAHAPSDLHAATLPPFGVVIVSIE